MSLQALIRDPFELLLELERRARVAIAAREGADDSAEQWIGIGFRLGTENFVSARTDVREVLAIPEQLARIPGAKPWLRGIANVRGQLITVVDLKAFLGGGSVGSDRRARMLLVASREVPAGLIVDEVVGFRRFTQDEYSETPLTTVIRCEHYLEGGYRRGAETWPRFSLLKLLEDEHFSNAGGHSKV